MKKILFFLVIFTTLSYGQKKQSHSLGKKNSSEKTIVTGLSNRCLREFLNICATNCLNGNQNLNAFAFYKFNLKWGAPCKDAANSYLNAEYNEWMRDKIFIHFYNSSEEWMNFNLIELGLSLDYSKQLSRFLYKNIDVLNERDQLYEKNIIYTSKLIEQNNRKIDYINETNIFNKHNLLNSLYSAIYFENDSLIVRKENAIDANNNYKNIDIYFMTEVVKEFQYEEISNNINDKLQNKVAVILASYRISSMSEKKIKKNYPNYTIVIFEQFEDSWKSQRNTNLTLNEEQPFNIKMGIDNSEYKYYIYFENTLKNNSIRTKYFDLKKFEFDIFKEIEE